MKILRVALLIMMIPLPSFAKVWILRALGGKVGRGCRIGFTYIDARYVTIGDNVLIASFNLLHRLKTITLKSGSRMNGFNWITGARVGKFFLGRNSAVTRMHFFESSGDIIIGDNTIIAGRNSHFFTHGISATNLDDVRPIVIGDWCYIGSSTRWVPGSGIADRTFVGMGAVLTKPYGQGCVLLAGNPAVVRKQLMPTSPYFNRSFLPHDHHKAWYRG